MTSWAILLLCVLSFNEMTILFGEGNPHFSDNPGMHNNEPTTTAAETVQMRAAGSSPDGPKEENLATVADHHKAVGHEVRSMVDRLELQRMFQMYDKNGDGLITKSELAVSLKNVGIFIPEKDLTPLIERVDANGDGCVDLKEFATLYKIIMEKKEGEDEGESLRDAFKIYDQNGDGFISADELQPVMVSLGFKGTTVEDCKRMIAKVDADGNGKVDYNEFKQMMKGKGSAV